MSTGSSRLDEIARRLDQARRRVDAVGQVSRHEHLDLSEAYAVLLEGAKLRAKRGDVPAGLKLGFTSREKAEQMGVSDVILGVLSEHMEVAPETELTYGTLIHPRVEPELAFHLAENLEREKFHDPEHDLLAHVTHVAPAIEVIDSRYRDFVFSLEDVVADNTSASHFVVGPWSELAMVGADGIADLSVTLTINGTVATSGSTASILGNPLNAVAAAARLSREHLHPVRGGFILLAGAATPAVPLPPAAEVVAQIEGLGAATLRTTWGASPMDAHQRREA